ncbi:hypothetical protein K239x_28480 [Planctomycetes bacterium K23_9]|uniref:Uncharacterized protein n=1 Tax=Stieleria marina TaxID=1930275 RepID=A0A517NUP9_9BACT|nr:hypothetical protein K239x_28480 [Planctomycetes bacterium K23_9]
MIPDENGLYFPILIKRVSLFFCDLLPTAPAVGLGVRRSPNRQARVAFVDRTPDADRATFDENDVRIWQ